MADARYGFVAIYLVIGMVCLAIMRACEPPVSNDNFVVRLLEELAMLFLIAIWPLIAFAACWSATKWLLGRRTQTKARRKILT